MRSVSPPSSSHPTISRVVEELQRLKTWELASTSTAGSINFGLSELEKLYAFMESVLNLKSIQELLSRKSGFMDELLDATVKVIDVSNLLKDLLLRFEEKIQALESALRRRKGDCAMVNEYTVFRKNMKKEVKKLMAPRVNLGGEKRTQSSASVSDESFAMITHVLREVDYICFCVFKSLLAFVSSSPPKSKQGKWNLLSKIGKTEMRSNGYKRGRMNEIERVDAALMEEKLKCEEVKDGLRGLEMSIKNMEINLGSISRRLIKIRASMLNIVSRP